MWVTEKDAIVNGLSGETIKTFLGEIDQTQESAFWDANTNRAKTLYESLVYIIGKLNDVQGVVGGVASTPNLTGLTNSVNGLISALNTIKSNGWGCLLYLRQEGRGIGLHSKIQAYNLQDKGLDTLEANLELGLPGDARDYELAAKMLTVIGVEKVCLLTNNPEKVNQLKKYKIDVVERMSLVVGIGEYNRKYLETKIEKMGHEINKDDLNNNIK